MSIPNLLHDSVPDGYEESMNQESRVWGGPRIFDFKVKEHVGLGHNLRLFEFKTATKISGSCFAGIKKEIERLKDKFIKQKEQLFSIVRTSKKKEVIKLEDGYVEVYVDKEGNPTRTYYSLDVEKLKKLPKEDFDKIRKRNLWFTREV